MLKQCFIKIGDLLLGKSACKLFPQAKKPSVNAAPISRILLIRPGGIGDAVLLAPVIRTLRKKYPGAQLAILAEQRNAGIFGLVSGVDRVLRYDAPGELAATVFRLQPDLVIDTEQWHRLSAVVARLTGAPTLIGFGTNERARLFHHAIPYSHDDYEIDSFFHLLAPLGIQPPGKTPFPFLETAGPDRITAQKLLAPLASRPFLTIFPGASIAARKWSAKKFSQLARQLNQKDVQVVVVGAKEDISTGQEILARNRGINLAGKTTLAETAAVIDQSALLISGDSGILHLGVGLDKPTVSLFGPGIAKKWAPRGEKHIVINKNPPCSPCTRFGYTPKCPINAKCMADITVEEVFGAAMKLLKKYPPKHLP